MIVAVEASRSHCQPPSVRLQFDFDPQLHWSIPEDNQENEQQQKVHNKHLLSTPENTQTPRSPRGFAFGVRGPQAFLKQTRDFRAFRSRKGMIAELRGKLGFQNGTRIVRSWKIAGENACFTTSLFRSIVRRLHRPLIA